MSRNPTPSILIDAELEDVEAEFRRDVRWTPGLRVNLDARLIMLGLRRLRDRLNWTDEMLSSCSVVLGCRVGSMESYEGFDRSLVGGWPAPIAFSHALPSIPLACASLCFSLRGQTITLAGDANVGLHALEQASRLVRVGRSARAIAGCWEVPHENAGRPPDAGNRCRALLVALDDASAALYRQPSNGAAGTGSASPSPVERLAYQLQRQLDDARP